MSRSASDAVSSPPPPLTCPSSSPRRALARRGGPEAVRPISRICAPRAPTRPRAHSRCVVLSQLVALFFRPIQPGVTSRDVDALDAAGLRHAKEDSFDARSSDSYPTTPHGEEPGSLTPRCASTSPVHEDLVQQIMLGEQASSATSAATPRSVLLANLHAAALGARDASLALLAHDATLDEGESARLDGPRIETMARRYALDAQQVEVWMDEAALMGGGGTAAGACAPFIRPLGRGQSAPPQVVDNTCDNEAAAALLLNQQASTQSHGLFRSRDKEPSPRAGSCL